MPFLYKNYSDHNADTLALWSKGVYTGAWLPKVHQHRERAELRHFLVDMAQFCSCPFHATQHSNFTCYRALHEMLVNMALAVLISPSHVLHCLLLLHLSHSAPESPGIVPIHCTSSIVFALPAVLCGTV